MMRLLIALAAFCGPTLALAQDPCVFVPGGCPPENIIVTNAVPVLASLLLRAAGGLSIIMIIYACYIMLFNWGDDGKVQTARNMIVYSLTGIGLALLSQMAISFVSSEAQSLAILGPFDLDLALMSSVVRIMVTAFNVFMGFVIFMAGVKMLLARGKADEYAKARSMLAYAITAAVIVTLSHFAVQAVITTLQ